MTHGENTSPENFPEDRISSLPDEVLVSIMAQRLSRVRDDSSRHRLVPSRYDSEILGSSKRHREKSKRPSHTESFRVIPS